MSSAMKLASVQMTPGPVRRMAVTTVFPRAFGAVKFASQIMLQVYVYNPQQHQARKFTTFHGEERPII